MNKKSHLTVQAVVGLILPLVGVAVKADPLQVDIYSGFVNTGGGAPYTDLVGSFTSPDIQFGTSTGNAWHPFALDSFGADITGRISVSNSGNYTFTLNSDDGSQLFIDGVMAVDDGGPHSPATKSDTLSLAAGFHNIEVRFFECCGGESGLNLTLPNGVTYAAPVPVPSAIWLYGSGLAVMGYLGKRRNA